MITPFSRLELGHQEFIALSVSQLLAEQLNRTVSEKRVKEIFLVEDVDVQIMEDGTMTVLRNEKLEAAVKKITAVF